MVFEMTIDHVSTLFSQTFKCIFGPLTHIGTAQWDSRDFATMEFCTVLYAILLEKLLLKMCQTAALQKLP